MADYKNIKGFNIQYLDSDPPNPIEGQMWFNSTTQTLKGVEAGGISLGTWASGGDLNSAGSKFAAGNIGTQTATLAAGGYRPAEVSASSNVESYDGTAWTEVNNLTQALRNLGGAGSSTSAFIATGTDSVGALPTVTNAWDGTSWTDVAEVNTGREAVASSGASSSSGLLMGGYYAPGYQALTESFNGTTWTEVSDLNTARYSLGATGIQTATIAFGGAIPPGNTNTSANEFWNGTSWTEVGDLNTARQNTLGAGTTTAGLAVGGNVPSPASQYAQTEFYNGTSWTELNDLATARGGLGGGGSAFSATFGGGSAAPGIIAATEEWTVPDYVVKTFTTS